MRRGRKERRARAQPHLPKIPNTKDPKQTPLSKDKKAISRSLTQSPDRAHNCADGRVVQSPRCIINSSIAPHPAPHTAQRSHSHIALWATCNRIKIKDSTQMTRMDYGSCWNFLFTGPNPVHIQQSPAKLCGVLLSEWATLSPTPRYPRHALCLAACSLNIKIFTGPHPLRPTLYSLHKIDQ